ncbi:hypothetical protein SEA_ET2BRUTUS_45 [Mycobacterium phage Et2Brutus]|nr:hypothetical protein SEA_ET2BRUTUS_45 [Mycobacterium phage Et2Brutus]QBI99073.1 hypothetical protein SEA_SALZ_45 [Mycobacterium phage Salz]QHJ86555.1 membrane protein [Mycobacterium phage Mabel]
MEFLKNIGLVLLVVVSVFSWVLVVAGIDTWLSASSFDNIDKALLTFFSITAVTSTAGFFTLVL